MIALCHKWVEHLKLSNADEHPYYKNENCQDKNQINKAYFDLYIKLVFFFAKNYSNYFS